MVVVVVVRSAETEGMANEADISRGSDHFHRGVVVERRTAGRGWRNEPREIVIQRGGTLVEAKFEFKAGRSGWTGDDRGTEASPN